MTPRLNVRRSEALLRGQKRPARGDSPSAHQVGEPSVAMPRSSDEAVAEEVRWMEIREAASQHLMRSAFSRTVNEDMIGLSAAHGGIHRIVCECSRRMCTELLDVTAAEYEAVRAHPTRLLVVPGHELADVQRSGLPDSLGRGRPGATGISSHAGWSDARPPPGQREAPAGVDRTKDEPFTSKVWAINLRSAGLSVLEAPTASGGWRGRVPNSRISLPLTSCSLDSTASSWPGRWARTSTRAGFR